MHLCQCHSLPNKVFGRDTLPALALPNADKARAWVSGVFIRLEVHQALGEHKQFTSLEHLSKELVGGIHKPDLETSLHDKEKLGRARVGVGWIDAPRCKL